MSTILSITSLNLACYAAIKTPPKTLLSATKSVLLAKPKHNHFLSVSKGLSAEKSNLLVPSVWTSCKSNEPNHDALDKLNFELFNISKDSLKSLTTLENSMGLLCEAGQIVDAIFALKYAAETLEMEEETLLLLLPTYEITAGYTQKSLNSLCLALEEMSQESKVTAGFVRQILQHFKRGNALGAEASLKFVKVEFKLHAKLNKLPELGVNGAQSEKHALSVATENGTNSR